MRDVVYVEELEYDENDKLTVKSQLRKDVVDNLVKEWNQINRTIERRSWRDRDERLDEESYHADQADEFSYNKEGDALKENPNLTKEELKEIRKMARDEYYAQVEEEENKIYLRQDAIEEMLMELGCRMARPYEHWNEDERYMEYMENRYDSYEDY